MWSSAVGQPPCPEDWDRLRGDAMKVGGRGVEERLGSIQCFGSNRLMSMRESFQVPDKGYCEVVGGGLGAKGAEEREEYFHELVTDWLELVGHWDDLN